MRADIFVELTISVDVPGSTLAEAVEQAKKLKASDLFKVKQGEATDWAISVLGVNHDWPSQGDKGE